LANCPGIPQNCFPVAPSSDEAHSVLIDWNWVQYDTLNATQTGPWRYVAPTSGRYRVSALIRYIPYGPVSAGQVVELLGFVNAANPFNNTSSPFFLGGFSFEADNPSLGQLPYLFLQGDTEMQVNAGDNLTVEVFQNTGQTGYVDTASHVFVERLGD
jgi:hypothetical protein